MMTSPQVEVFPIQRLIPENAKKILRRLVTSQRRLDDGGQQEDFRLASVSCSLLDFKKTQGFLKQDSDKT